MSNDDAVLGSGADASNEPVLAVDEIQGNALPGFGTRHVAFVGLKLAPGREAEARRWLRALAPRLSTLQQVNTLREVRRAVARATGRRHHTPDLLHNALVGVGALRAFGFDLARVEATFTGGMARAEFRDPRDAQGAPVGWVVGATADETPDVLLILGSDEEAVVDAELKALAGLEVARDGLALTYVERGAALPGDIEHFGFRDGISQPGVRGRLSARPDHVLTRRYFDPGDPRAASFARPGQPLLWPGQFVFGYATELEDDPTTPGPVAKPPAPWMEHGSFVVYRRLRQDVAAFRRFTSEQAAAVSERLGRAVTSEALQALIVGRWPDGTPLARSPGGPDAALSDDDHAINFFAYAEAEHDAVVVEEGRARTVAGVSDDADGARCPHFAHIRKVNLRDKLTDQGPSSRFRILRRGIPFGPPYVEGESAGIERGLLFVSYQRALQPQFMTLVATWMNSHDAPEGFGHDLLVGQGGVRFAAVPGGAEPRRILEAPAGATWIIPTGGGFFFSPSVSFFRGL